MRISKLLALASGCVLTACSQGADIASPGATNPGLGGGASGGTAGGGAGGGAACPSGTSNAGALGALTVCNLTGEILTNLTLPNLPNIVYRLNGRVDVGRDIGGDGGLPGGVSATLTIQPSVIVFGGAANDMLVVNRGSQIQANGVAANPIVFTSQPSLQGFNGLESSRQWAGLIIVGRAPTRKCATAVPAESVNCQNEIEGVTASTGRPARYGGATPGDSSGSLQFVQIKFAGAFLPGAAAGDDLNGLSLGGVGSGTTIQNVQVHNSGDDGIEIFGGRVNLKNFIVTGAFDDAVDCDEGWTGTAQFGIIIQRLYSAGGGGPDNQVECSNAVGLATGAGAVQTRPVIANFTFVGTPLNNGGSPIRGIEIDSSGGGSPGASGRYFNGVVIGSTRCLSVSAADNGARGPADLALNPPTFHSVLFDCGAGTFSAEAVSLITAGTNNSGPTSFQAVYTPHTLAVPSAPAVAATINFNTRFVNGPNETARTAFDLTTLANPFLTPTTYIGAVRNNADNWWRTWSCGLETNNC